MGTGPRKHSQCQHTDSRSLPTWEEPETSGGWMVQDLKEDTTACSPFEKKSAYIPVVNAAEKYK